MGTSEQIDQMVDKLCERVDIPPNLLDHYPHELDGGRRQRIGVARAIA
mgnify:FL=1